MLSEDDGKYLLSVAKDAIETYVKENRKIDTPSDNICMRNLEFL